LHLVVPQRFFPHAQNPRGDRHVYAARTRFIPQALLPLFDCTTWPVATADAAHQSVVRQVRIDVGARMRSMWQ
jgi:DNA helicase-2/ATP-dependent DNA helicase PcrA